MMNKKLIAPILSVCAFLGLGVGSTYALFTSNANTDIQIKAGKVSISSALSGLKTYSVTPDDDGTITDEFGKKYSQPETAVAGEFTNGGTAALSDDKVVLNLVSPGDKVEFNYSISNASTIQVKYRYTIKCASSLPEDIEFFSKLKFVVDGEDFTGISKYVTEWRSSSTAEKVEDLDISVEVPTTLMSEFGARNCAIEIYAEAVQANAYVTDDEAGKTFVKAAVSKDITLATGDVTIKTEDNAYSTVVKAADIEALQESIPAPTATNTYGLELGLVINELESTVEYEKNLDIDLKATLYTYDAQGNVEDAKPSKPTLTEYAVATVNIGKGLFDVKASHNGIPMVNSADTKDDKGNNGVYTYDSASGVLTIKTKTFSPFSVSYVKGYWKDMAAEEFSDIDTSLKTIGIHSEEEMALFANTNNSYDGYKVSLKEDLDFGGFYWESISITWGHTFTFDGENHTIKGLNINAYDDAKASDDEKTYTGFFVAFAGEAKNVIFKDCFAEGERVGIFAGASRGEMSVENISVIDCKVVGGQKCAGIVGVLFGQDDDGSSYHSVKNCNVENLSLDAYDSNGGLWQSGGLIGYIGIGVGVDVIGNTIKNVIMLNDACEGLSEDQPYYSAELIGSICNYGTAKYPHVYSDYEIKINDNTITSLEVNGFAKCPKMAEEHYFIGWMLYESTSTRTVYKVVINGVEVTASTSN